MNYPTKAPKTHWTNGTGLASCNGRSTIGMMAYRTSTPDDVTCKACRNKMVKAALKAAA